MKTNKCYVKMNLNDMLSRRKHILNIIEKYGLDVKKVEFNDDMSINYNGNVDLSNNDFDEIPINFNIVSGWFRISNTKIKSLKNIPKKLLDDRFSCYNSDELLNIDDLIGVNYMYDIDCRNLTQLSDDISYGIIKYLLDNKKTNKHFTPNNIIEKCEIMKENYDKIQEEENKKYIESCKEVHKKVKTSEEHIQELRNCNPICNSEGVVYKIKKDKL